MGEWRPERGRGTGRENARVEGEGDVRWEEVKERERNGGRR